MIIVLLVLAFCIAGCVQPPAGDTDVLIETEPDVVNDPAELIDKRGVQTNITEFNELVRRASAIESFKYALVDSDEDEEYYFYGKQRFYRVELPKMLEHDTGEVFDTVYMERTTRTALSRCRDSCAEVDMEFEKVDYDYFYRLDPYEQLTRFNPDSYIRDDMIGNDYVKVFSGRYMSGNATAWIQEYYGYPLKIEYTKEDGSTRTIEFNDMEIDTVRMGEIQLPFNCTVKGEEGNWWIWEHYLGEMKKSDMMIGTPDMPVEVSA